MHHEKGSVNSETVCRNVYLLVYIGAGSGVAGGGGGSCPPNKKVGGGGGGQNAFLPPPPPPPPKKKKSSKGVKMIVFLTQKKITIIKT